jgi:sugar phosphate isomerase/epimerase
MTTLSFEEILAEVELHGVKTYEMSVLREANKSGKLGSNIRAEIKNKLSELGLNFIGLNESQGSSRYFSPDELPDAGWKKVRLYKKDTYLSSLINAVFEFWENPDNADKLLAKAGANEVEKMFAKVMKLQEKIAAHQDEITSLLNPNSNQNAEPEGRT